MHAPLAHPIAHPVADPALCPVRERPVAPRRTSGIMTGRLRPLTGAQGAGMRPSGGGPPGACR